MELCGKRRSYMASLLTAPRATSSTVSASGASPLSVWLQPKTLFAAVLALTALRLVFAATIGLSEDEAYYRLWGLHPAWGYYDHPPMIAWWISAGQALAGDTALGVRVLTVLSVAAGSILLWRTGFVLFGAAAAGWAVWLFHAMPLIAIGGMIATPDAPSVFFWGAALWALAELERSRNAGWWLVVGLMAGLGLLSKYSLLFLGAGIFLWLILVPEARGWLRAWQLWVGGGLALILFAPVLLWNMAHEWASFTKQFGRAAPDELTMRYVGEFVGAFVGLANPLVVVLSGIGVAMGLRWRLRGDLRVAMLIVTGLPFVTYLLFHSLHARVQANWPAPLVTSIALLAAFTVAAATPSRISLYRQWAFVAIGLGVGLSSRAA